MKLDEQRVSTKTIRLFLITENRIMREALSAVFQRQPDFSVVASVHSDSAHDLIDSTAYDVLLVEQASAVTLPADFISAMLSRCATAKIVLFGMKNDPASFLQAVRSGVSGYLLEEAGAKEIVAAIRKVVAGEAVSPPSLCHFLFEFVARASREGSMILNQRLCYELGLTNRQQQLVALLARGFTNKEIAQSLNLSQFTVKNHVRRIIRQLNAPSRYAAVQMVCVSNATVLTTS
jgi:two-component system, NarL family, nitrate/nitrite response regulator NarL